MPFGMDDDNYLKVVEGAHRKTHGEQFCYCAVPYRADGTGDPDFYRIGIVNKNEHGYYPLSDDFFIGTNRECQAKADQLNRDRLSLQRRAAAVIVASSMHTMMEK